MFYNHTCLSEKYICKLFQTASNQHLVFGRKPCARVVFSPHGVLKLPVLRQVKNS